MPVSPTELKHYKSSVVTDTSANGGRISRNPVVSGALRNLFPGTMPAERESGMVRYRKLCTRVENADKLPLYEAYAYMSTTTPGDDWITMFPGSPRDTMADHVSIPRAYGTGLLKLDVAAGASSVVITCESAAVAACFLADDEIVISSAVIPVAGLASTYGLASWEKHKIGAKAVSGLDITITLANGAVLANGYTVAAGTIVAGLMSLGSDIAATYSLALTGGGSYDSATYPVEMDFTGVEEETYTFSWIDNSTFTVLGDTIGALPTGTISTDYSPDNPRKPGHKLFSLRAAGHGGIHVAGDTITLTTHPPCLYSWHKHEVPAGAQVPSAPNRYTFQILYLS